MLGDCRWGTSCHFSHDAAVERPSHDRAQQRRSATFDGDTAEAGPSSKKLRGNVEGEAANRLGRLEDSRDRLKIYNKETRGKVETLTTQVNAEVAARQDATRVQDARITASTAEARQAQDGALAQTTAHYNAMLAHFAKVATQNMKTAHDWFVAEMKATLEREGESHKLSYEKYGGNRAMKLLRDRDPAGAFFVATLQPITDVRFMLTCTVDGEEVPMQEVWSGAPCRIKGGPDCSFNLRVLRPLDNAADDAEFFGGNATGYSRVLRVSGDMSLGAALRAVEAWIFKCKVCDGTVQDCVHCSYKATLPPSPDFNPVSPPQLDCPEFVLDAFVLDAFVLDASGGDSDSRHGSREGDRDQSRSVSRDRVKGRSKNRDKKSTR